MLCDYHPSKIGIAPQNMPQTSNSPLSQQNEWLPGSTNGNQGQTMLDL